MAESKEQRKWNNLNATGVIEKMQRDGEAPYWALCSEFVWAMVARFFPRFPPHLRERIAQESLLRVHKNLASFQGGSNFTTWILQIIRNYACDLYRQRKNGEAREVYSDDDLPDEHPGYISIVVSKTPEDMALLMERHREVQVWLHEYLQQHANQARNERIFQMVLYDGYSNKEAAQLLGISEAVVGTVVRPAREYLQQKLQKRDA